MDDHGNSISAINYTSEGKIFILWFKYFSSALLHYSGVTSCNNSKHFTQCFVFLALEQVDVAPVVKRDADHIAVFTSNVLFFVILFIFAVFET